MKATEPAFVLARRAELGPFVRLCQGVAELLPPDQAALTWAQWLIAAAEAGGDQAQTLLAAYVRWLREEDIADIAVSERTGHLLRKL